MLTLLLLLDLWGKVANFTFYSPLLPLNGPQCEKTCLWGFANAGLNLNLLQTQMKGFLASWPKCFSLNS